MALARAVTWSLVGIVCVLVLATVAAAPPEDAPHERGKGPERTADPGPPSDPHAPAAPAGSAEARDDSSTEGAGAPAAREERPRGPPADAERAEPAAPARAEPTREDPPARAEPPPRAASAREETPRADAPARPERAPPEPAARAERAEAARTEPVRADPPRREVPVHSERAPPEPPARAERAHTQDPDPAPRGPPAEDAREPRARTTPLEEPPRAQAMPMEPARAPEPAPGPRAEPAPLALPTRPPVPVVAEPAPAFAARAMAPVERPARWDAGASAPVMALVPAAHEAPVPTVKPAPADAPPATRGSEGGRGGRLRRLLARLGGFALAVLGWRRVDARTALRHDARAAIVDHVRENPGAHLRAIARALSLTPQNAAHHVRKLEACGLVGVTRTGGRACYYAADGGQHERQVARRAAAMGDGLARRVHAVIADTPGLHQAEIARRLGVRHGSASWAVKRLVREGFLEEERDGARLCYRAIGPAPTVKDAPERPARPASASPA